MFFDSSVWICVELGDGTKGTIRIETIHRFKGLESEAVICIFDPETSRTYQDNEINRLGYIGLSRTKTLLAVLASEEILKQLNI